MLNFLRQSANTWVIKILLVFIALSFMVWGVGDYVNRSNNLPVVVAKNWTIQNREFAVAYDNEFQQMRRRFGGSLDKKTAEVLGLKQRTLNALINRHLILDEAAVMRLTICSCCCSRRWRRSRTRTLTPAMQTCCCCRPAASSPLVCAPCRLVGWRIVGAAAA